MDTAGVMAESETVCGAAAEVDQEVMWAQQMLDQYHDASSFWDSRSGQDALAIAQEHGLKSRTPDWDRRRYHNAIMLNARNPQAGEFCSHAYEPIPGGKGQYCTECGWDE